MNPSKEILLITGSSGLIGQALCQRAAERYKIITFDRRRSPHLPLHGESLTVDLASPEQLQRALRSVKQLHGDRIAAVIHLAAYYDFSGDPSSKYDEINVQGTRRLLCGLQDFHVEQFIFSSTMLVHAPCEPGQYIDERWPLQPKWEYPESKVKAEQSICAERGSIPAVLLRIAGVYNDRCHLPTLAHQIQRIYERWLVSSLFPGNTKHGQAALHLDDLIDAFLLLIQARAQLPAELPLLVGEPDTVSYEYLQRKLGLLIHDEEWITQEIPKPLAKMGAWVEDALPLGEEPFIKPWMIDLADDHYALDITRARRLIGWDPRHRLRTSLSKMVAALQADPLAWYYEHKLTPPDWLTERAAAAPSHRPSWGSTPDAHPRGQPR